MKKTFRRFDREHALRCASNPTPFLSCLETVFEKRGQTEIQKKLFHLYEHWSMVMGEELESLALPIGHRKDVLLIAAEDNIALNELSYSCEEILERVHAFLGEAYFIRVELHLLQERRPLNENFELYEKPEKIELVRPENLGKLNFPEGKVKDAYLHYLSLFEK